MYAGIKHNYDVRYNRNIVQYTLITNKVLNNMKTQLYGRCNHLMRFFFSIIITLLFFFLFFFNANFSTLMQKARLLSLFTLFSKTSKIFCRKTMLKKLLL